MTKEPNNVTRQRAIALAKLARAIYEAAVNEEDKDWLPLYESFVIKADRLFGKASREDGVLHPDFGGDLLDFVRFKNDMLNIPQEVQEENAEKVAALMASRRDS